MWLTAGQGFFAPMSLDRERPRPHLPCSSGCPAPLIHMNTQEEAMVVVRDIMQTDILRAVAEGNLLR